MDFQTVLQGKNSATAHDTFPIRTARKIGSGRLRGKLFSLPEGQFSGSLTLIRRWAETAR